jgi:hypothetical protein
MISPFYIISLANHPNRIEAVYPHILIQQALKISLAGLSCVLGSLNAMLVVLARIARPTICQNPI